MTNSMINYFDLPDPHLYHCDIWRLDVQKTLKLRLYIPYKPGQIWLIFSGLVYLDSVNSWAGANFELLSNQDCLQIMRTLRSTYIREMTDDEIMKTYRFFRVRCQNQAEGKYSHILCKDGFIETR